MLSPYKGYSTQRTTQKNYAKLRHQPSDRDQKAQQHLKDKISKAQIHNITYITLGKSALQTIQQMFDPGFPVSFHLSLLQTSAEKGTIPTLYVVQTDRHCMPTHQSRKIPQQLIIKLHGNPPRSCTNYLAEDGEGQDEMNYIVTIPTEPTPDHSKAEYNRK